MRRLLRSWRHRVAVVGHSMEPTLRAGDWLLVDPHAYRRRSPATGDLVVAVDPRQPARWLVKRVAELQADTALLLAGDHLAHRLGPDAAVRVAHSDVIGRPWLRYWPPTRLGRLS
jgi:signal peptidase I